MTVTDRCIYRKQRALWNPRVWQLLREPGAARMARSVIPPVVDDVSFVFPDVQLSVGLHITLTSLALPRQMLIEMIYDPPMKRASIRYGLVVLAALQAANLGQRTPGFFGAAYWPLRKWKAEATISRLSGVLAPAEVSAVHGLLSQRLETIFLPRALVHGDLHAGNIIVDVEREQIGLIDLEMMHVGSQATNLAQLWLSFLIADRALGQDFYAQFRERGLCPVDSVFTQAVRAEAVLCCCCLLRDGIRGGNMELRNRAHALLLDFLHGPTLHECRVFSEEPQP